ncbi:hypothetical protein B0A71_15900 [Flavobacterium tructae]|uniref:DUF11 domain-containing protein n=1 Tax=Flavobacterium tructae TaxID=1114873 RepID=A0A1S1J7H5_9FLAO|nr:hypothetical protein BHE19_07875 [Flavobacterium tructae]OXB18399.1 hypothetical protein B0A71_15900 [Flavobacterium tructae]
MSYAGHAQVTITAVASNTSCVGNGSITVTVNNVTVPITYAIAKLPFNEATVITSPDPVFINLATGDYYYGYYNGTTFVRAAASINVGSSFSTVSPTITSVSAKNYTYCGNDPDPLGTVSVRISGGNGPYTISLLNASDNSEVQKITTSLTNYNFTNLLPGAYKVQLTDNCGATTTSLNTVTLSANVIFKSSDLQIVTKTSLSNSDVDIVYNTTGDVCSGVKSATLVNGFKAVVSHFYINTTPDFLVGFNDATSSIRYKLEIQNGTGWDVYDNLTRAQAEQRFVLPSDRSEWGEVRLTGTYCGLSRTITQDYGASSIGKPLAFKFDFRIVDDPANTNCSTTGKVRLSGNGMGANWAMTGCLPYNLEVTNNATGIKTDYTLTDGRLDIGLVNCLLDIGETYTVKITDNAGTEAPSYFFRNDTSSATKKNISDKNNVFIDPVYFSPPTSDLKSQIQILTGPSAQYFGKSALGMNAPIGVTGTVGLEGAVTISLESGPSALTVVQILDNSGKKTGNFRLGNDLTPGTYKIRVKDSGCFNEVFDVVLDTYFTKIEITKASYEVSPSICDRYIKKATVTVSAVGSAIISSKLEGLYSTPRFYVNTFKGPVAGEGNINSVIGVTLAKGVFDFSFQPQISGDYEIGIAKNYITGNNFSQPGDLWGNTTTVSLSVKSNFPIFDLSQSGGIVCAGNTTGDLYVKVNNTLDTDTVTYFIKKDTDAAFPANGQTSPVFKGLEAGNYVVRAKTACYEVDQALILRAKPDPLIKGKSSYCKGDSLKLDISDVGPVTSIIWTLTDGTTSNATQLALDNVTTAQSGSYKVEINTIGGCYFSESINITINDPQTPTTSKTTQEFCKTDNKTVADLAVNESGVTWYDAATGGNAVASTTLLENNKVYYGSLKEGTCESPTRLAVTVTLSDPKTPTTSKTTQEFCKTDNKTVADLAVNESGVTWYDAATAGNAVASTTLLENNKVYYGSLKAGTCESPTRLAVTVTLSDPKTPTTTKTTQEFCKADNKTVADLAVNESGVTWYDAATAGNVVASTTTLEDNKVYYGSLKAGTCESPTRLAVTVTLSDPKAPTTSKTTQEFCKTDNKTVADLAVNESGVTWYDAANNGNVIAGTILLENNKVYYGSLKAGTCESPTRLAVTVTLSDLQTPTTSKTTQEFCKTDNKTVADLAVNESGVTWYDAANNGNAVASTTTLENNKLYYGSLKAGTCESPTRLLVTVTLSDPKTPTTSKTTQEFCKADNKTVADLAVNESGVTWYNAATAGSVIASTTVLENNKVYYGSLKAGTCESPTRLAVTVTLSDPQTPTTSKTTQEFCKTDNKTVADLAVNESGVTWYDAATGGNAVASTTTLEDNKVYYGSLKAGTCESSTRLVVTVTLSDPKTPTTSKTTQEFCKADNKTVADLAVNESGVTWYDAANNGNVIAATTTLEDNKVYYGSLKAGICESPIRLAVKTIVKSCTTESPHWDSGACVFDEATYKVASGMSDYNWIVSKEGVIVAGGESTDDYVTVIWNSAGKATVKAEYIDVSKFDPLVLIDFPVAVNSCSDVGLKKTVDNPTPGIGHQVVFTITAENLGINAVKEVVISEKLPSGYDYVTSQTSSGSYNSIDGIWMLPVLQAQENQTLKITAKVKELGDYLNIAYLKNSNPVDINEMNNRAEASIVIADVIVYNAISINGDGLNDYFKITGLHNYPNNTVEIFNRNGVQIFKTHNYGGNNNVFRGISEGRATISKKSGVPTGTYFYILRYERAGVFRERVGYLYVSNN